MWSSPTGLRRSEEFPGAGELEKSHHPGAHGAQGEGAAGARTLLPGVEDGAQAGAVEEGDGGQVERYTGRVGEECEPQGPAQRAGVRAALTATTTGAARVTFAVIEGCGSVEGGRGAGRGGVRPETMKWSDGTGWRPPLGRPNLFIPSLLSPSSLMCQKSHEIDFWS